MNQLRGLLPLFVIFSMMLLISAQNQYCRINKHHTMCMYSNKGPVCNAKTAGLTSRQINELLKAHNDFRQYVASGKETRGNPTGQPAAKYMPKMVWDKELANIAQTWANQCTFEHDTSRDVQRFSVGQNLASFYSSGEMPEDIMMTLVKIWYDEVENFDAKNIENFDFKYNVGHYTQLLWASSVKLGCGYVVYKDGDWNKAILACNYGSAGNVHGGKMYDIKY